MFQIRQRLGDLRRLREIATAFAMGGFSYEVRRIGLSGCVSLRCKIKCLLKRHCDCPADAHSLPVHFRKVIEGLGPTFVKLGQLLSLRPDVIPVEYCDELSRLQDQVPGFPYKEAVGIIEKDLGRPISSLFASFDKDPIAAASIAQVHRARLKDGTRVAVKVIRPGVSEIIMKDIRIMEYIAGLLERRVPDSRQFRPKRFVQEFKDWTLREIDFRNEASVMQEMGDVFAQSKLLKIPKVCTEYTTRRVVVMEFMEGVHIDDSAGLRKLHADRRNLAVNGVRIIVEQTLVRGLFHGDPHPGNILVRRGDGFCFLDFGIVGRLSERQRRKISLYMIYLFQRDFERALSHLLALADIAEESDLDGFRRKVLDIMGACYGSLETNSISQALFRCIVAGVPCRVYFPSDLVLLSKSFVTIESVGRNLCPQFSILRDARKSVEETLRGQLGPRRSLQNLIKNSTDYSEIIEELPIHVVKVLGMIEKGRVTVNVDKKSLGGYIGELHEAHNIRMLSMIVAALIIGSALTSFLTQGPPHMISLPMIQIYLALGLSLWIIRYAK